MPYFDPPNITDPMGAMTYTNAITENFFGVGILVTIFLILFISFKGYEMEKAFAASSFISTVMAFMMVLIRILSPNIAIMMIVITALSVIFLLFQKD